jgi:FixJ family two-component response regulator
MAARAMKVGAVDVLTKPVNDADLLQAVRLALAQDQAARADREALDTLRRRAGTLTPREREVFALVIAGLLNKQIAGELGTSQRTVKVHRGRVMRKMQAHSVAELVRFADRLGIPPVLPTSCARPAPAIRQVTPLPAAPAEGVPA